MDVSTLIPKNIAQDIPTIGLRLERESLIVAIPEHFTDKQTDAALSRIVESTDVSVEAQFVDAEIISQYVENVYNGYSAEHFTAPTSLNTRSEGPIIDLVNRVVSAAVKLRASDIHIEPVEEKLNIRLRIDGKLEKLLELPAIYASPVISRLKVLSKLSIVEKRRPQDGQFSMEVDGRDIDIRLSTISTIFGEKAALRLLDTRRIINDLMSLGMSEDKYETFSKILKGRHGLLVSAGPTGSGKTTTLHSALQIINSPDLNVCTIEDPVEYVIPGINHIPVNEQANLTFATQLRAIVRQDPDVVMVGEIRDPETAKIAVQAALSGRLVLSTLHAPDALGSVFRLFQMGIEPYQVAASLVGVVSQRLIRKNCAFCSENFSPPKSQVALLAERFAGRKFNFKKGKGCTFCRHTGYLDRVGVFQFLEIEEDLRELISQRPSPVQLERASRKFGFKPLNDEALELVASGVTTFAEALNLDIYDEN